MLTNRQKIYLPFKRFFAILFAILLLLLTCWLFLIISIGIKLSSKGSIFFTQDRIGKNKKIFKVYKFRTMIMETPNNIPTHMLVNSKDYITKFGRFLRATSLDEIPQLINILKGDMAFVGPRPALYNQEDLLIERDKYHANDIVPGLTGLAQIQGKGELPISVKAKYDGEYTQRFNIWVDIKICLLTVFVVITHKKIKEDK